MSMVNFYFVNSEKSKLRKWSKRSSPLLPVQISSKDYYSWRVGGSYTIHGTPPFLPKLAVHNNRSVNEPPFCADLMLIFSYIQSLIAGHTYLSCLLLFN